MIDTQLKDYLKKYRIDSEESLAKHIEELKRNTKPNNEIIFPLVDLLLNEKSVLLSFFRENSKEKRETTYVRTVTPFFLDEAIYSTRHKAREEGKFHKEPFLVENSPLKYKDINRFVEIKLDDKKLEKKNNYIIYVFTKDLLPKILEFEDLRAIKSILKKYNASSYRVYDKDKNLIEQDVLNKDDVITSSSRGEKETMEYLQGVKKDLPPYNLYDNSNYWKHSLENWTDRLVGVKESQTAEKAPIFTYCKVNKNALEALSLRALYGHKKYIETDQDWQNFTRVPNALEEYGNAEFRHALGIGEEDEETHLVAEAWNAVAKLEVFLRDKLNKS